MNIIYDVIYSNTVFAAYSSLCVNRNHNDAMKTRGIRRDMCANEYAIRARIVNLFVVEFLRCIILHIGLQRTNTNFDPIH